MSWIRKWTTSKRRLSWKYVNHACREISNQINSTDIVPDHVVALARGGLIPGTVIANMLNVRQVYSIGLSSYHLNDDGIETQQVFDVYQRLAINDKHIRPGDHVLIVDDISDKGTTFDNVIKLISSTHAVKISTASIVMKPKTTHQPTFCHEVVNDSKWIVFPWEKQ